MKNAYATILSSENFLPGVKKLYKAIRKFSDKEVVVFIGDEISLETEQELKDLGLSVIRENEPVFDEGIISERQAMDRWNKTLFKLVIFREHGYEKFVYLDSDLLIRDNIDDLFEKPEWSAVPDELFFPKYGRKGMNAGVMVVKPSEETYRTLIELTKTVSEKMRVFGDQDVINELLTDWDDNTELQLDEEYNSCFYSKCSCKKPKVVHFILESKPWMWSKKDIFLKKAKWFLTFQSRKIKYLNEYLRG